MFGQLGGLTKSEYGSPVAVSVADPRRIQLEINHGLQQKASTHFLEIDRTCTL